MQHYQSRSVAVWAYAIAAVIGLTGIGAGIGLGLAASELALIGPALLLIGLIVANFASLAVWVDERELRWRFGAGPLGRRIPLDRIRGAEARRSPWYWGWGIRWTPNGWLWRSHGLDAVWIELEDGKRIGVGTQDPGGLVDAIRQRLD